MHDTGTHAIRVLLVDDHDLFRTGLRNLLEEQGVDIVAEASSGSEALQLRAGGSRPTSSSWT